MGGGTGVYLSDANVPTAAGHDRLLDRRWAAGRALRKGIRANWKTKTLTSRDEVPETDRHGVRRGMRHSTFNDIQMGKGRSFASEWVNDTRQSTPEKSISRWRDVCFFGVRRRKLRETRWKMDGRSYHQRDCCNVREYTR